MKRFWAIGPNVPLVAVILVTAMLAIDAIAQPPSRRPPDHRDVPYDDDHSAQCMDVYLADSDVPTPAIVYIHGGGWRAGSKSNVPAWLRALRDQNVATVVAVEYRFTDVATHPAQVNDCRRAIQFVRKHAEQWNLDPQQMGVTGGSAGGHLSAYVALADDRADPDAADPVDRQSSRVALAISFAGPTDWALLKTIDHQHPAYRQLIGYPPGTAANKMSEDLMRRVSPISFASQDDPPVMMVHGDADQIVPLEHSRALHQRLTELGVPNELVIIPGGDHSVAGAGGSVSQRPGEFVRRHLLSREPAGS